MGINEENLACFSARDGEAPLYFLTRLPFTYDEAHRVVREAVVADQWESMGVLALSRPTDKRPVASYESYETTVTLYGQSYRAVVIHSSAHDKRRQKRIDRDLKQSKETLNSAINESGKRVYHCHADAAAELQRRQALKAPFHQIEGVVEERIRDTRGRPRKDGTRNVRDRRYQVCAQVVEKPEAAALKRAEAGCFVLISNRPSDGDDGQTAEQLLRGYKDQNGVEQNYRFLKDPLIVNDLFLKNPKRIEVLGMVLLMCLLIWNLMQRTMRLHLERTGTRLEGWDGRATDRPTSFMMLTKFIGIMVVASGPVRVLKPALTPVQQTYLTALDVPESVFIDPRPPP